MVLTRAGLALLVALAWPAAPARATELIEAWQAAVQHDKAHAVAAAAHTVAQPRRDQATALWKPRVSLSASLGLATNETEAQGAQFSAPGLGTSKGVGFATSVTNGSAGRWSVTAAMPLYNPERRAQQRQLNLSADLADLAWQNAAQALMLRTAEAYFELALAEDTVRVLGGQMAAVQRAATEAQDRFQLGAIPVTATHEARARLAGLRAQWLAAQTERDLLRQRLADSTGLPIAGLGARLPGALSMQDAATSNDDAAALDHWLSQSQTGHPEIRTRLLSVALARQEAEKFSRRASASVDLVAQAGRERASGSGDFGPAGNTGVNRMVGVQLTVPLFTGGYRDAKEDEALRLADQAAAELALTREQVAQQTRAAWLRWQVGGQRLRALEEALAASLSRADATGTGRDVGQRTTLDVLNAENDAAAARLALAQGRVAWLLDRLRLAALAGRLDENLLRATQAALSAAPLT